MTAAIFESRNLGPVRLRNRVIKTATFEGMTPAGQPNRRLWEHHTGLARGGVGMTTVAYCAVSDEGRTFGDQMYMHSGVEPALAEICDGVHEEGAAISIQLGHCGGFSKNPALQGGPLGPSRGVNTYGVCSGKPMTKPMTKADLRRTRMDFVNAAKRAKSIGFDAIELHLGHGYLLSQFLSPGTNKRSDEYGGSLENRLRFPLEVVESVVDAVGGQMAIIAKTNLCDGYDGGLELDEAVEIACRLEQTELDGLLLSGGLVSRSAFYLLRGGRPLPQMVKVEKNPLQKVLLNTVGRFLVGPYPFEELFFFDQAIAIRKAVKMPLILLGSAVSLQNLTKATQAGFDFVAMGRALIADPNLVKEVEAGQKQRSRCNHCNLCMTEMDRPQGVRCVL